jgi:hypothetical protein
MSRCSDALPWRCRFNTAAKQPIKSQKGNPQPGVQYQNIDVPNLQPATSEVPAEATNAGLKDQRRDSSILAQVDLMVDGLDADCAETVREFPVVILN